MATIAAANVDVAYSEGSGEKNALLRLRNVTTADTFDVSTITPAFYKVKAATFIQAGVINGTGVGTISASGTVLTFTLASMAGSTIYAWVTGL